MTNLAPRPMPGAIADSIARIRSELLHLEHLCSGVYVTDRGADDLRDAARRLDALCRPDKGHLQQGAKAAPLKDAA